MPVAAKVTTGFKIYKLLSIFAGLTAQPAVMAAGSKERPQGADGPQDKSAVTQGDNGDDCAKDEHDDGAGDAAVQKS